MGSETIRVLIADDSRFAREFVKRIFRENSGFEPVAEAVDLESIRVACDSHSVDVVLLDMHLLDCTGIQALQEILIPRSLRTVILSAFTAEGSREAIEALAAGAADVLQKPILKSDADYDHFSRELIQKVRAVVKPDSHRQEAPVELLSVDPQAEVQLSTVDLIAIGASTGGTEAVARVLFGLPRQGAYPPVLIVQHMPPIFTRAFAELLNAKSPIPVCEAHEGQVLEPNRAYVAPGDYHLTLERDPEIQKVFIRLNQMDRIHGVRPAIDYSFKSVAELFPGRAIGVILTGMGRDGAEGLLRMRQQGCATLGQSERTCVVYGMPKAAREINAAQGELDLNDIAPTLARFVKI